MEVQTTPIYEFTKLQLSKSTHERLSRLKRILQMEENKDLTFDETLNLIIDYAETFNPQLAKYNGTV